MTPKHHHERNYITNMRRNRRLLQKQLAMLIGHHYPVMVSKYERGVSLPPLEAAILLEVALGAHLSELYPDLYGRSQCLVLKNAKGLPLGLRKQVRERLLGKKEDVNT